MPGSAGGNWSIYEGEKEDGAGDRSRTYDLRITNALLYQLSYTGTVDACGEPAAFDGTLRYGAT